MRVEANPQKVEMQATRDANAARSGKTLCLATLVLMADLVLRGREPMIAGLLVVTLVPNAVTLVVHTWDGARPRRNRGTAARRILLIGRRRFRL